MRESRCLIVICSPNSAQSRWVEDEIRHFKSLGREAQIFCLIVDGEPNASDKPGCDSPECFSAALRHHVDERGELMKGRTEPIAADVRAHGDGRTHAFLKLVAGLLGVGLDALIHRDQRTENTPVCRQQCRVVKPSDAAWDC